MVICCLLIVVNMSSLLVAFKGCDYLVGFNNNLVLGKRGKIYDYQKSYNNENSKLLNVFLPLNFNNKELYTMELAMAIDNTFPKDVVIVKGVKSETDLNKYMFDLTNLYRNYYSAQNKKPGLCKIKLYSENENLIYESENFRI